MKHTLHARAHTRPVVAAMKIALCLEVPLQRNSVITRAYSFKIKRDNADGGRLRAAKDDVKDVIRTLCRICIDARVPSL